MSYELEVNLPNVPKGTMVEVSGLGAYENGKTSPVPDDLLALWRLNNTTVDDDGNVVTPALGKQNFQDGIVVRRAKGAPPEKKEDEKKEDEKQEGGN